MWLSAVQVGSVHGAALQVGPVIHEVGDFDDN